MLPAESLSTLKFASRAKRIQNVASVNEDADQTTLLRKYEAELRRLRGELQQRQATVVDKRHLLQVQRVLRPMQADVQLLHTCRYSCTSGSTQGMPCSPQPGDHQSGFQQGLRTGMGCDLRCPSMPSALQVEAERRQAEADKVAAITALERASREFMREKAEKRALEARIASMQSQMLVGGARLEDSPAVRCVSITLGPLTSVAACMHRHSLATH